MDIGRMRLEEFDFALPSDLIAQKPLKPRSSSRLLCLERETGKITHRFFRELPDLLTSNDLVVMNNTRVMPARLQVNKITGGKLEILIERILETDRILAQIRNGKSLKLGDRLFLANGINFEIVALRDHLFELLLPASIVVEDILNRFGKPPLPPYIRRDVTLDDSDNYQTIYAKKLGSVAAPTAGLHFDRELIDRLFENKIKTTFVTLHVGLGTFKPVRTQNIIDHKMHAEYIEVSSEVCEMISNTRKSGGRVVVVGTTTLRSLETANRTGQITPYYGDTNIFIYGNYNFISSDVLITNFHLPKSTLLMLVASFGGYDNIMRAYREAIAQNYRFYSYGDAMVII